MTLRTSANRTATRKKCYSPNLIYLISASLISHRLIQANCDNINSNIHVFIFLEFWASFGSLALIFESFAGIVELLIAAWLWVLRRKAHTEALEHRKETLERGFSLIAALCVIVAVGATWRVVVLQSAAEDKQTKLNSSFEQLKTNSQALSNKLDTATKQLKSRSDFLLLLTKIKANDRNAFDQLYKLASNTTNTLSDEAKASYESILDTDAQTPFARRTWKHTITEGTQWKLATALNGVSSPDERIDIIEGYMFLMNDKDKKQKSAHFYEVYYAYKTEKNLHVVSFIGRILIRASQHPDQPISPNNPLKLTLDELGKYRPLDVDQMAHWAAEEGWDREKGSFHDNVIFLWPTRQSKPDEWPGEHPCLLASGLPPIPPLTLLRWDLCVLLWRIFSPPWLCFFQFVVRRSMLDVRCSLFILVPFELVCGHSSPLQSASICVHPRLNVFRLPFRVLCVLCG